jgi:CheY-like chemotaxis protein
MGILGHVTLLRRHTLESEVLTTGEEQAAAPPALESYLDGIDQLVESGAALTAQLLGFARGGKYDLQATDVRQLLERSLSIFGRTKREVEIEQIFEDGLWTVEVDRSQLEQVMLNLYLNAWQAMPGGGLMQVEAENAPLDAEAAQARGLAVGDYVRIRVRDNGVGMEEAVRARVFEPFFTTKELGRGTGLGLASAYAIVQNHGGSIEAQSGVGAGSCFVIHLPASKREVQSLGPTPPRATRRGSETILLVDDEVWLRRATKLMLEELGYRVVTAPDGPTALRCFEEPGAAVSAVVLDMIMPARGGAEVFAALRARAPGLPILLSSGYSQDARADELLRSGAAAYLQKPYRLEALSEKLRELLDEQEPAS